MPLFHSEEKFDRTKLQTNLKMAVTRLNMQKNKRENLVKLQRREIADLLRNKKEESARIKVESALREAYTVEAYEFLQLFIDLLAARIQLLSESRICPPDIKEAVSTVIWAAPRVENTPELLTVREQFVRKFGKEFVQAAANNTEMAVNQKVFYRLSMQVPEPYLCIQYMKDVANQYQLDWEPTQAIVSGIHIDNAVHAGLPDPVSCHPTNLPPPPMPPSHTPMPNGPPMNQPMNQPVYYQPNAPPPPIAPSNGYGLPPPMMPPSAPIAPPQYPPPPDAGYYPPPQHQAPRAPVDDEYSDLEQRLNALKRGNQ